MDFNMALQRLEVSNSFIADVNGRFNALPNVADLLDDSVGEQNVRDALYAYGSEISSLTNFMYTLKATLKRFNDIQSTDIQERMMSRRVDVMESALEEHMQHTANALNNNFNKRLEVVASIKEKTTDNMKSAVSYLESIIFRLRSVENELKQLYGSKIGDGRYKAADIIEDESKQLQVEVAAMLGLTIAKEDVKLMKVELGGKS